MLDRLLRDHVLIREKAQVLLHLLDSETMPSRAVLAETRWNLGSLIMQHLAYEDRHLYAKLLHDSRADVRETGRQFHSDLATLFAAYASNAQHWTPDRIAQDWDGFRADARRMTLAMFARIDLEEAELYPLAAGAAIDLKTNFAPTTNWTREAFAIKDAIIQGAHKPIV
ncbi:hemerythrin domain-containing protein [Blastomonas sp.]|uniref:hemerythrin domain-containing protein n=1 Tax=Blastomonas sp. TaxID=1909299 RepID=UPI00262D1A5C|nr:hemerythrin domain-containing protein [Blastomonas sp.]MDM7954904.1 hemerythrin domain-containing protein [Blastomonas sp.]